MFSSYLRSLAPSQINLGRSISTKTNYGGTGFYAGQGLGQNEKDRGSKILHGYFTLPQLMELNKNYNSNMGISSIYPNISEKTGKIIRGNTINLTQHMLSDRNFIEALKNARMNNKPFPNAGSAHLSLLHEPSPFEDYATSSGSLHSEPKAIYGALNKSEKMHLKPNYNQHDLDELLLQNRELIDPTGLNFVQTNRHPCAFNGQNDRNCVDFLGKMLPPGGIAIHHLPHNTSKPRKYFNKDMAEDLSSQILEAKREYPDFKNPFSFAKGGRVREQIPPYLTKSFMEKFMADKQSY